MRLDIGRPETPSGITADFVHSALPRRPANIGLIVRVKRRNSIGAKRRILGAASIIRGLAKAFRPRFRHGVLVVCELALIRCVQHLGLVFRQCHAGRKAHRQGYFHVRNRQRDVPGRRLWRSVLPIGRSLWHCLLHWRRTIAAGTVAGGFLCML